MDFDFLAKTTVFNGISPRDLKALLDCLNAHSRKYKKGEYIYRAEERIDTMGLVLSGSVIVEHNDIWGRQTIWERIEEGRIFAEVYAFFHGEPLMVDVVAEKDAQILFMKAGKIMTSCSSGCAFHSRLIGNMLSIMAFKNLNLSRKIRLITPRTIRERLMLFLSYQAVSRGGRRFEIPFNRQQLADYLCVDRSAMSSELGKMRDEGILKFRKNKFELSEKVFGGD